MRLYCRGGRVIATHSDTQLVPASAYGDGVVVMTVPDATILAGEASPPLTADVLKAAAQAKRKSVIAGGCVVAVDGLQIPIWADDKTVATLTALMLRASGNPGIVVQSWKARDGAFFELNATDISALADGLFAFIQAAFDAEGAIVADVDAENITTIDEIEAAAWPSNG